jgi:hypothetical protein
MLRIARYRDSSVAKRAFCGPQRLRASTPSSEVSDTRCRKNRARRISFHAGNPRARFAWDSRHFFNTPATPLALTAGDHFDFQSVVAGKGNWMTRERNPFYFGSALNAGFGVDATRNLLTFVSRTAAALEVEVGAVS